MMIRLSASSKHDIYKGGSLKQTTIVSNNRDVSGGAVCTEPRAYRDLRDMLRLTGVLCDNHHHDNHDRRCVGFSLS